MIKVERVAGALAVLIAIVGAGPAGAGEPSGASVAPAAPVFNAPAASIAPATATRSPIVITWTAPEGCPSADAIRAEVRRMAGAAAVSAEATEAHATVRRDRGGGWQLTLTTKAGALEGERKLGASDCAELGRAAALVIALMINPAADLSAAPPVAAASPLRPPLPGPPRARRLAVGAGLLVGSGEMPGTAVGLGARLAVERGLFSTRVRASFWLPHDASSPAKPSAGGSFEAAEIGLAGCLTARHERRLAPGACGGALVSGIRATGFGVSNPGSATAISAGAFLEGELRARFTARNTLRLGVEALAPLERPTFALAGVGAVFRPAAFWLRGALGWELNF